MAITRYFSIFLFNLILLVSVGLIAATFGVIYLLLLFWKHKFLIFIKWLVKLDLFFILIINLVETILLISIWSNIKEFEGLEGIGYFGFILFLPFFYSASAVLITILIATLLSIKNIKPSKR